MTYAKARFRKIAKPSRLKVVKKNLAGEKLAKILNSPGAVTEPKAGTVIVDDGSVPF